MWSGLGGGGPPTDISHSNRLSRGKMQGGNFCPHRTSKGPFRLICRHLKRCGDCQAWQCSGRLCVLSSHISPSARAAWVPAAWPAMGRFQTRLVPSEQSCWIPRLGVYTWTEERPESQVVAKVLLIPGLRRIAPEGSGTDS